MVDPVPLITADNRPADWVKLSDYRQVAYLNVILGIAVILQNFLVTAGYYPERKKLIPMFFLLIAGADTVIAVGEICRVILVFSCPHRLEIKESTTSLAALVSLMPSLSILGWTCSTFYNVVLTVYRTVTLADPFSGGSWRKTVIVTISAGTIVWFVVEVLVLLCFLFKYDTSSYQEHYQTVGSLLRMHLSLPDLVEYLLVSVIIFDYHTISTFVLHIGAPIQLAIQGLPSLITLICIPLQVFFLRRSLRVCEAAASISKESINITVTILLINVLDFFCDIFCLLNYLIHGSGGESKHHYRLFAIFAVSTLPLFNALGFQLIMILRNRSMKKRYRTILSWPFMFFLEVVCWVRQRMQFRHTILQGRPKF